MIATTTMRAKVALVVAGWLGLGLSLMAAEPVAQTQPLPAYMNVALPFAQRAADLVGRMTLEEKAAQVQVQVAANSRLGIPAWNWWSEAGHGVARAGAATVFPDPIALAATWDPELVGRVAAATADEARAKFDPGGIALPRADAVVPDGGHGARSAVGTHSGDVRRRSVPHVAVGGPVRERIAGG